MGHGGLLACTVGLETGQCSLLTSSTCLLGNNTVHDMNVLGPVELPLQGLGATATGIAGVRVATLQLLQYLKPTGARHPWPRSI